MTEVQRTKTTAEAAAAAAAAAALALTHICGERSQMRKIHISLELMCCLQETDRVTHGEKEQN